MTKAITDYAQGAQGPHHELIDRLLTYADSCDADGMPQAASDLRAACDCIIGLKSALNRLKASQHPEGDRGEPVQDTWFIDRRLPILAMSGDIEDNRALRLLFRHKVTDEDRKRLIEVLNAGEAALAALPSTNSSRQDG